jgi:hypothetical protein
LEALIVIAKVFYEWLWLFAGVAVVAACEHYIAPARVATTAPRIGFKLIRYSGPNVVEMLSF